MAVQGWNIAGYPLITDDEGTYLSQAWAVRHGLGLAHYTYWYDHPPVGWIQLAAFSWLPELLAPDSPAVAAGRFVMLLVTVLAATMVYVVARRLGMARWAAATAVVLFGLSPLAVTLQRQIYLDNIAVAWMLVALAMALSRRRHLWLHVGSGVAAAIAVLSKETILLVVPAVLLALWQSSDRQTRAFSFAGFLSGIGLVGALYPLYALLNGELLPGAGHVSLIDAMFFQVADRTGSGSIFETGSGANTLLNSWLFYDPILVVGGVVAAATGLAFRRLRVPALAVVILVLVALRPNGYLPAMYIIQALPFFALALAGLVEVASRLILGKPMFDSPAHWSPPRSRRRRLPRWWPNRFRASAASLGTDSAPVSPAVMSSAPVSPVVVTAPVEVTTPATASTSGAVPPAEGPPRPATERRDPAAPSPGAALVLVTVPPPEQTPVRPPSRFTALLGQLGRLARISPLGRRLAEVRREHGYGGLVRLVVAGVAALLALGLVVPQWIQGDRRALVTDANDGYRAAIDWLDGNVTVPTETTIVVDDAIWIDMTEIGFEPGENIVWFYKLDLDPEVNHRFPTDEIDYIVSSPIVRQNQSTLPTVNELLSRSTVVATYGSGEERIEIRRIWTEQP